MPCKMSSRIFFRETFSAFSLQSGQNSDIFLETFTGILVCLFRHVSLLNIFLISFWNSHWNFTLISLKICSFFQMFHAGDSQHSSGKISVEIAVDISGERNKNTDKNTAPVEIPDNSWQNIQITFRIELRYKWR